MTQAEYYQYSKAVNPIEWLGDRLRILDQTRLPGEEIYLEISSYQEVAQAIKELMVRGAPMIGVAAAYGVTLGAQSIKAESKEDYLSKLNFITQDIASTRPTAVNLFKTIERMKVAAQGGGDIPQIQESLLNEAYKIHAEEEESTRQLSNLGAEIIKDGFTVLTHCNAGTLATTGYGTALGVIRAAKEQGKKVMVFADETRPLLQGARLTTWELMQDGISVTLITDSMAGHFMSKGQINCVIVGTDRVAANGDVANKIGTYSLAVLAKENGIPFYVAAPISSIDFSLASGEEIPIEERSPKEVTQIKGISIAPEGVMVANPAFDVTPHRYVSAIITEKEIVREPYEKNLSLLSGNLGQTG
ncbi:S-methyl-5-thioribose-1-phosphate isomerase [Chloroflexota bacterium]